MIRQPSPFEFFNRLVWLDGRPLASTIEPYRREIFEKVLFDLDSNGTPRINLALCGRAKKNFKSTDMILAALYRAVVWRSPYGNTAAIVANDEAQAADDLEIAAKLVRCNPILSQSVEVLAKEIRCRDGCGSVRIIPARDTIGQHGKTLSFLGIDEIHGYRDWRLLEALQPDPTRPDAVCWVTSYDTIYDSEGVPLHDLKKLAQEGTDPRFYFSWYSADICTDANFAKLPPEERANPSMASWPDGRGYLEQQRRRLPTHKFRRLHLNLPGAPDGAFLDQASVMNSVVNGRKQLPPIAGIQYRGYVDMSGGSADDATCAVAHTEGGKVIVDAVWAQLGDPPFNPRDAVARFARELHRYRIRTVRGDAYAGQTFRADFAREGIGYEVTKVRTSDLYEAFEPRLNAGEVELLDIPKLRDQLLGLVVKGARVDHASGQHDDYAAAVAGVVAMTCEPERKLLIGYMTGYGCCGPIEWDHQQKARSWVRRKVDENGTVVSS